MTFDKLLNGGYIIYFRHAEATVGNDDQTVKFEDCRTQRNLSETGKQQAMIIGKVIRQTGIPIEPVVISSPFCRAIDTAKLAFPNKIIRIVQSLAEIVTLSEVPTITDAKRKIIIHENRRLFELPPSTGQNRIIIGHSFPKEIELGNLPYMTGIVIQPKGWRKGYEVIGKLDFNEIN
ncbi:histidine phosphatase family protein [Psychrobacillus sp. FSL H8-0483]|uniref:histidine phosphatase family protein n=1 Tax=Psychrobacillus sp. FSL H8-0483 TaxID=2921389 RepID=UPI00315A6CFA